MSEVATNTTAGAEVAQPQTTGEKVAAKVASKLKSGEPGITKESLKAQPKVEAKDTAKPVEKTGDLAPQKYKLTRNGKEVEVDHDTYHRFAQKAYAADAELAEAKALKREAEQKDFQLQQALQQIEAMKKRRPSERVSALLSELEDNPEALNEFRGSVEEWLVARLKEESASPELQRALKAERELKKREEADKRKQEDDKRAAWKKSVDEARPAQQKLIIDTLQLTGLPPTEWNVKAVADVIFNARQKGHKPTPEQVASIVKEDRIDNIRAVAGGISQQINEAYKAKDYDTVLKVGDSLAEMFGEDILKALRAYDIRKHLSGVPTLPKKTEEVQKAADEPKGSYEFKSMDEWIDARRKAVATMK